MRVDGLPFLGVLLLSACLPGSMFADGGLFIHGVPVDEGLSTDQRAILVHEPQAGTETIVLSTKYDGPAADFAWLIPLPSLPSREQIATVPNGEWMFDELSQRTQPIGITEEYVGVGCGGCGGGSDTLDAPGGVEVVDHITIAGLDISLLNATDSSDLIQWLNTNDYRYPATASDALDFYITKGWQFVAVKVDTPDAATYQTSAGYFPEDPLKLTFATEQLVFPVRISAVSTRAEGASVLLYAFSAHRVRDAELPTVDMQMPAGVFGSPEEFRLAYEQALRTRLAELGGRAMLVEYAGEAPWAQDANSSLRPLLPSESGYYLTRLRTVMGPAQMTDDVVLVRNETDASVDLQMLAGRGGMTRTAALALALAVAYFLLRRRRGRVQVRRAITEAAWVALATLFAVGVS